MIEENKGGPSGRVQWVVPTGVAAILAGMLNSTADNYLFIQDNRDTIALFIPPISILIGYFVSLLSAKFFSLSYEEMRALSRLSKNEKIITKELAKKNLSEQRKNELQIEIDNISRERTSLLKRNGGAEVLASK